MTKRPASFSVMRALAIGLLAIALGLGGWLRLADLGAREMSPDEAASWAAAEAPTLAQVIRRQGRMNPGKLPVHEIALHGWIRLFGPSLVSMRSLSAVFGIAAIALVTFAGLELLRIDDWPGAGDRWSRDERLLIVAITALVLAANLVTTKYSREARMYSLTVATALAQVGFFLRSARRGGIANLFGTAVSTALMLAVHFASVLIVVTEAAWIGLILWPRPRETEPRGTRNSLWPIAGVAAGALLLLPFLPAALSGSSAALARGSVSWIAMPPPWAAWVMFNKATGSFAFPVMASLAVWGAIRSWRLHRGTVLFAVVWMWLPPVAATLVSYLWRPLFVERYLLASFAPFFLLVALGIRELRSRLGASAALTVVLALALGHVHRYYQRSHDRQWREATAFVAARLSPGRSITALPPYAVRVLRYYLGPVQRSLAVRYKGGESRADFLILEVRRSKSPGGEEVRRVFPDVVARFRGIVVRSRRSPSLRSSTPAGPSD